MEFNNIFLTITSGVMVFIISQYIILLIIKPYKEYREVKVKIANKLKYYANVITNPLNLNSENVAHTKIDRIFENYLKASDEIRILSCDLEARYYDNFSWIRKMYIKDNVENASSLLIGLSNKLFKFPETQFGSAGLLNSDDIDKIKINLNLNK